MILHVKLYRRILKCVLCAGQKEQKRPTKTSYFQMPLSFYCPETQHYLTMLGNKFCIVYLIISKKIICLKSLVLDWQLSTHWIAYNLKSDFKNSHFLTYYLAHSSSFPTLCAVQRLSHAWNMVVPLFSVGFPLYWPTCPYLRNIVRGIVMADPQTCFITLDCRVRYWRALLY